MYKTGSTIRSFVCVFLIVHFIQILQIISWRPNEDDRKSEMWDSGMDSSRDVRIKKNSGKMLLHPLMVDLIVQQIFEALDITSLKSSRQVCKRWKSLASEAFVSKTRLDLVLVTEKGELEDLFEYAENASCEPFENIALTLEAANRTECATLGRLVKYFIDPLKDSILSFHFHACHAALSDPSSGSPILARVLMLPLRLRSLSLSVLPSVLIDNLTIFLKYRKKHLPLQYLKYFRIYGRCVYPVGFLELLMSEMQSIKTIVLKDPNIQTTENLLKLLIKFKFKKLKELRFDGICFLEGSQIEDLVSAKLKLNSLQIDLSCFHDLPGADYEKITLLVNTSATLKTLRVNHKGRDRLPGSNLVLPYLPVLMSLHLEDWSDFGSLNFMDQLPNLKVLSLQSRVKNYEWMNPPISLTDFVPSKTSTYPQLIEINLLPVTLPETSFKQILISFPNLKKLSMKGTESLLNILYRSSTPIQELTLLTESGISDCGIAGIFDHYSTDLNNGENASVIEPRSSIKNLNSLRKFQIDGFYSLITDVSVQYGLKFLNNLTSLSLRNCNLTPRSLKELGALPLMFLDLTNSLPSCKDDLVLSEIAQLKERKPFLHIIWDQDRD